jgi:hypothetical protein
MMLIGNISMTCPVQDSNNCPQVEMYRKVEWIYICRLIPSLSSFRLDLKQKMGSGFFSVHSRILSFRVRFIDQLTSHFCSLILFNHYPSLPMNDSHTKQDLTNGGLSDFDGILSFVITSMWWWNHIRSAGNDNASRVFLIALSQLHRVSGYCLASGSPVNQCSLFWQRMLGETRVMTMLWVEVCWPSSGREKFKSFGKKMPLITMYV